MDFEEDFGEKNNAYSELIYIYCEIFDCCT